MILVFGGTTEGKQAVEVLEALQLTFVYSTKTKISFQEAKYGAYRFGAFSEQTLMDYIKTNEVSLIINASHPFASELHITIANVAKKLNLDVLRLERNYPKRIVNNLIHYVDGYDDVLSMLKGKYNGKTVLALTGVQSIAKLSDYWKTTQSYFRILDRKSSIEIATKASFPEAQLILGMPNKTVDAELALLKERNIEIIITKESGDSGALSVKIDAALREEIPIIIIKKPELPKSFQIIKNSKELSDRLIKLTSSSLITNNS